MNFTSEDGVVGCGDVKNEKGAKNLPWVEQGTIETNVTRQEVKFRVKDPAAFDLNAVRRVIDEAGFEVGKVKQEPGLRQ